MLEKIFKLKENNTSVKTELIAGFTTFITMAYIIFVNPQMMSSTGMDQGASFVGTCLAAAIACILMGLYANWPCLHLPLMDDKRVRGRRSRLGIRAVGHAGRPEAVRELLLEGLSPQEGPQKCRFDVCTESSRRVASICPEKVRNVHFLRRFGCPAAHCV